MKCFVPLLSLALLFFSACAQPPTPIAFQGQERERFTRCTLRPDRQDFGTHDGSKPDDYPDYALAVGQAIQCGEADVGILICGSGVGAAVAANKVRGVRAALCSDTYSGHQSREHDDCNVLCLGARVTGPELALEIVRAFVDARFSGEERHRRRLKKVEQIERG